MTDHRTLRDRLDDEILRRLAEASDDDLAPAVGKGQSAATLEPNPEEAEILKDHLELRQHLEYAKQASGQKGDVRCAECLEKVECPTMMRLSAKYFPNGYADD